MEMIKKPSILTGLTYVSVIIGGWCLKGNRQSCTGNSDVLDGIYTPLKTCHVVVVGASDIMSVRVLHVRGGFKKFLDRRNRVS